MPVVVYTLLRVLVFLAATGVLWWVGMRSWLAPLVGAVIAWALTYVLLPRQRDAAARYVAARAEQRARTTRADEDAAAEDAALDAPQDGPATP